MAINHKQINLCITGIAALAGLVAILKYFDDKRYDVIKAELLKMEHELKILEIEKAKATLLT